VLKDPTQFGLAARLGELRYRDYVDAQIVIGGGPATVRDQLEELVANLRVGNLLLMVQMGSMPHELALKNIDLLAREVLPAIRNTWEAEWTHEWWPRSLQERRPPAAAAATA
jgi:hypothetical protein